MNKLLLHQNSFAIRTLLYSIFIITLSYIHYFLERQQTTPLLLSFTGLFLLYIYLVKKGSSDWKEILAIAILARIVLFFGLPNLSDDFYRFIWDGKLLAAGINPFANIPSYYASSNFPISGLNDELYQLLNSKSYFTVYPPISQFIFWVSIKLNPNDSITTSVFIMRLIIFISEIGSIILIKKLLDIHQRTVSKLSIYALNPLVILELTGNLHFEAVMIFFLLLSIYLFYNKRMSSSAMTIAASVATKLTPLMLLPIFIRRHQGYIKYYLVVGVSLILIFIPILSSEFIHGISGSLSLFFRNFEFNGGLFFLIRAIGFYIKGYDVIQTIGPLMSIIALVIILLVSLLMVNKSSKLESIFIIVFFIQLIFATTVHPWYVLPMLALSAMTNYKFPMVWSFFIFLTYAGYSISGFEHPFYMIAIEYLIVIPLAIYEINKFQTQDLKFKK